MNIDAGFLNLMTQGGTSKDDVKVPDSDLGKQIQADFDEGKDLLATVVVSMARSRLRRTRKPQGFLKVCTATITTASVPRTAIHRTCVLFYFPLCDLHHVVLSTVVLSTPSPDLYCYIVLLGHTTGRWNLGCCDTCMTL